MGKLGIRLVLAAAVAAMLGGVAMGVQAQGYPNRAVTLIAPFAAGGDADLSARNLAAVAQRLLGQPVVVVNRAGASGAIGSQQVRDAAPDGYTLLLARVGSHAVLPAMQPKTGYRWNDFTTLGLLELNPVACVVHPESAHKTLADLAAALKANPGKLNYSSSGQGTILHLASQLLLQSQGLAPDAAAHISYKGGSEAALAVLQREVDFSCGNLTSMLGQIKGGKLRALVVTTPERVADIADVPTAREAGVPALEAIVGWSALVGPPKMSAEAVQRWTELLQRAARDAEWLAGNVRYGGVPRVLSPAETEKYIAAQFDDYTKLLRQLGLEQK